MAVSQQYREYVLEQLGRVVPVTARSMFGGVGIYADGLFVGLMADDVLYLKVDDGNRDDFVAMGYGPFHPYGDDRAMQYYELPAELLDDTEQLRTWVGKAQAAAAAAKRRKRR